MSEHTPEPTVPKDPDALTFEELAIIADEPAPTTEYPYSEGDEQEVFDEEESE